MSYIALYRKYRPDSFEQVKGQEHIVTTLKNQILQQRIGHAYLFCGTRGTGKTTMAKLMAKMVNCLNPTEGGPCGVCSNCKAIAAGASMSVIEIDAASNNGVDNVRQIIDEVSFSPADGCKKKVYIIDEVHMLSAGAFNALLKTIEEPPDYCMFILATTDPQKVPITILSRCQRYDFKRISVDTIASRLEEVAELEHIDVEPRALRYIAKAADGAMRDALSMLDQCVAFHYGEKLTLDHVLGVLGAVDASVFGELIQSVINQDIVGSLQIIDNIVMQGREIQQFVSDFTWYLRNLLVVKSTNSSEDILDMSMENLEQLTSVASLIELEVIIRYIRVFSELGNSIRFSSSKRILTEIAIIKLCKPEMERNSEALINRISNVEKKLESGIIATPRRVVTEVSDIPGEKMRQLPSALPEDIQRIVDSWSRIIMSVGGYTGSVLRKSYPSLDDKNQLKIVIKDSQGKVYLSGDFGREQLSKALDEYAQAHVEFSIEEIPSDGSKDNLNPNILKLAGIEAEVVYDSSEEEEYV